VNPLNNQTVGQSLTLRCNVTTVRGINSKVNIVWNDIDSSMMLKSTDNVTPTTMDDSQIVYIDSYNISILNTSDNGREIQCEVEINVAPVVSSSGSITLDVIGKSCDVV